MLRHAFFRVNRYHESIPLQDDWYAIESDATFNVKKGSTVKATYNAPSRGIGRTTAVFNTQFCVYENGLGQVYCVDDDGNSTLLTSNANIKSIVCFDKSFCIVFFNSSTGVATANFYIIVGTKDAPFTELIASKELTLPVTAYIGASAKKTVTDAFVGQYYSSSEALYYCLKITKPDTFTNDESDVDNDATFEAVSGDMIAQEIPRPDAFIARDIVNGVFFYRNDVLDYYMVIGAASITIKKVSDDSTYSTGAIAFAGFTAYTVYAYLDNDTGDCVVIVNYLDGSGLNSKAYNLTSSGLSLITSINPSSGPIRPYGGGGLFPNFAGFVEMPAHYLSTDAKISFDGSSLTYTNSTTNDPLADFGNSIKWI